MNETNNQPILYVHKKWMFHMAVCWLPYVLVNSIFCFGDAVVVRWELLVLLR